MERGRANRRASQETAKRSMEKSRTLDRQKRRYRGLNLDH